MSFDSLTFRKALGCFPTGVTVATTVAGDGAPIGVTISSFTSLSLEPPLVLFCLDNKTPSMEAFKKNGHFAVNVLRHEQRELSIRFATRIDDKWSGVEYETWSSGTPIIKGCLANFECSIVAVHGGGDHQIFVGRVDRLQFAEAGQPLLYYRGTYVGCGSNLP